MAVHIIIDGYNLIRQSGTLKQIDRNDLQLGREVLVDRLAAYKRIKRHPITVVFDGTAKFSDLGKNTQEKGIRIKFSRHGETADDVIKRMAAREREKALVVSSDNEVIRFSAAQGSATISAQEFEEKMELAVLMDVKGDMAESGDDTGWTPTTKKKGTGKKRSKKDRRNQKKLSKL